MIVHEIERKEYKLLKGKTIDIFGILYDAMRF
jgi:hypothetical protein